MGLFSLVSELGIGRISTYSRNQSAREKITNKQREFALDAVRLNTGRRLINNYDQINGARNLVKATSSVFQQEQIINSTGDASSELSVAESALNKMKDLLDQVKQDAMDGGSGTKGPQDLKTLGIQLRSIGENLYQLANTKIGNRFIFGGKQSDLKVVDFRPGDLFANASYKQGQTDLGERFLAGRQTSVSLSNLFNINASSAVYTGSSFTSPIGSNAQLNLRVNDGTQDIFVGDVNLSTGDDVNTVVTKINAAFNAAGGQGSIAQNNSGKLKFDTALITNNVANAQASIVISDGTTLPNTLNTLGLQKITQNGSSKDLRQTLADLDSAYNSGDNTRVRQALVDLDSSMTRINEIQTNLGDLVNKLDDASKRGSETKDLAQAQYTKEAVIPTAIAVQRLSATQNVLTASMNAAATLVKQNIFDLIGL